MRLWDVHPGYLNRQSLLGEHRELHGLVAVVVGMKKGYARHPETLRWAGYGWALRQRHRLLVCEMALRGYAHRSPVVTRSAKGAWPPVYVDPPGEQYRLLRGKYVDREGGRIPLPESAHQLWSHHKYSVLARGTALYREIGREVAASPPAEGGDFSALALRLTELLRTPPTEGGIRNAAQHMWGYLPEGAGRAGTDPGAWPLRRLLRETQRRAVAARPPYLIRSTALSELMAWL